MKPRPGSANLSEVPPVPAPLDGSPSPGPDGPPFRGPGLLARVAPFVLVAVAAEASLALPPWTHAWPAVAVSLVLLATVGLAFLLPWDRLPAWMSVLVPLAYTGSALALTLAAGATSGVGIVVLIPLIWTALFHRPWESACVVTAIVAVMVIISVADSAPDVVIARRVLLWGALGALLAVATHGLRDRIHRSQGPAALLRGELMVMQDRDRLAADLQGSVVTKIFSVGLSLQGVLSLAPHAEVRRRVEASVADLDEAARLIRQAIFGLEHRPDPLALRQQVLRLAADVSPTPEITFGGPVDDALPPEAANRQLDLLRLALGQLESHDGPTFVCVEAADNLRFVVTRTGPLQSADGNGTGPDFAPLRERASRDGITIKIGPVPGGTRLAWSLPVTPPVAGRRSPARTANGSDYRP